MAINKSPHPIVFLLFAFLLQPLFCGCQTVRFQNPDGQAKSNSGNVDSVFEDLPRLENGKSFDGNPTSLATNQNDLELSTVNDHPGASIDSAIVQHETDLSYWSKVGQDYSNFYHSRNLPLALSTLGVGAWMANTEIDQNVLEHIQNEVTLNKSDEYYEFIGENKFFGEGYFLVPIYLGTSLLKNGPVHSDNKTLANIGEWGDRSFRSVLVGFPPLLAMQQILGGSRPTETAEGSEWQFLGDNNAVSGHSFMGAIPFLTAARMTENKAARFILFGASTLPALSRIAENGHFPSQALMGWVLGFMSVESVGKTSGNRQLGFRPWITKDTIGVGFSLRR